MPKGQHMIQRKNILNKKKLCYNCTGENHRAIDCRSKRTCQHCKEEKEQETSDKGSGEHFVNVGGIKCRALIDTGAGSSYMSSSLANRFKKNPLRKDYKQIETILHAETTKVKVYEVKVSNLEGNFKMSKQMSIRSTNHS